MQSIKTIFWNGLKAFVPIVLTIAIIMWIFSIIESLFGHFVPERVYFPGAGIILGVFIIFIIGVLVNAVIISQIYSVFERIIKRIPGVGAVYNAIQDLMRFFDKSQGSAQQTVMINTPMGKMIGFITCDSLTHTSPSLGGAQEVLVYIPLSYMLGGFTTIVSRSEITVLDWSVNVAMSFVMTAGMTGQKNT